MLRLTAASVIVALVSGSLLAARPAPGGDAQPAASVDLSGRWTYNVRLSDDAREKMREGMEKRGPGGGGMGGPGSGPGGPPGMGGADDPREAMRAVFEPAEELVIAQSESEIAVDEKFGRLRRLHPDGRKYKTDNGATDIKAFWKEGKLVVEAKRARGQSVTETWERVPDGSRLIVNVRLEGGVSPKLELKRIYDRASAAAETKAK